MKKLDEALARINREIDGLEAENAAELERAKKHKAEAEAARKAAETARAEADKKNDFAGVSEAVQKIQTATNAAAYYTGIETGCENDPIISVGRLEEIRDELTGLFADLEREHAKKAVAFIGKMQEDVATETDYSAQIKAIFWRLDDCMRLDVNDPQRLKHDLKGRYTLPHVIKQITDPQNGKAGDSLEMLESVANGR